jgi:hypothetical protein
MYNNVMTKSEFKNNIEVIDKVYSIRDRIEYSITNIDGDNLYFAREGKSNIEKISISEMYELYLNEERINTTEARKYIKGRVQSPAVAIVLKVKEMESQTESVS